MSISSGISVINDNGGFLIDSSNRNYVLVKQQTVAVNSSATIIVGAPGNPIITGSRGYSFYIDSINMQGDICQSVTISCFDIDSGGGSGTVRVYCYPVNVTEKYGMVVRTSDSQICYSSQYSLLKPTAVLEHVAHYYIGHASRDNFNMAAPPGWVSTGVEKYGQVYISGFRSLASYQPQWLVISGLTSLCTAETAFPAGQGFVVRQFAKYRLAFGIGRNGFLYGKYTSHLIEDSDWIYWHTDFIGIGDLINGAFIGAS